MNPGAGTRMMWSSSRTLNFHLTYYFSGVRSDV